MMMEKEDQEVMWMGLELGGFRRVRGRMVNDLCIGLGWTGLAYMISYIYGFISWISSMPCSSI